MILNTQQTDIHYDSSNLNQQNFITDRQSPNSSNGIGFSLSSSPSSSSLSPSPYHFHNSTPLFQSSHYSNTVETNISECLPFGSMNKQLSFSSKEPNDNYYFLNNQSMLNYSNNNFNQGTLSKTDNNYEKNDHLYNTPNKFFTTNANFQYRQELIQNSYPKTNYQYKNQASYFNDSTYSKNNSNMSNNSNEFNELFINRKQPENQFAYQEPHYIQNINLQTNHSKTLSYSTKAKSLTWFSIDAILSKPVEKKQYTLIMDSFIQKNPVEVKLNESKSEETIENVKEKGKRKRRFSTNESNSNKRMRTIFTQEQLDKLEVEFMKQQYMVGIERSYLASTLNLTESQIKIWFQNRRIKWRKTNGDEQQLNGLICQTNLNDKSQNDSRLASPFNNSVDSSDN